MSGMKRAVYRIGPNRRRIEKSIEKGGRNMKMKDTIKNYVTGI